MNCIDLRPVGISLLFLYVIIDYLRHKTADLPYRIIFYSFLVYLLFVAQYTTGGLQIPPRPGIAGQVIVQPLPFHFILDSINYRLHGQGWFLWSCLKLSFYNLIMLLPLGVYLRVLFGQKSLKKAALIVLLTSVFIETYQLVFSYLGLVFQRTFDVDDILLNTLGGAAGFYLCAAIIKSWAFRLFPEKKKEEAPISTQKTIYVDRDQAR